jgi:alanyl-tRNA synthetase
VSRLYYIEPWRREFDATVTRVTTNEGRLRVRLDRTAFYPTSGGQPFDTGALGDARVVDVVEAGDGEVEHIVEGPIADGDQVHGRIDWDRRFDHMQQHTGQHVLSAAFAHLHQARTESFHLGTACSTIDLGREVTPAQIGEAESEANRIVWDDRPVTIRFVSADEALRLPLRKEPARGGTLRLIDVEGFELSACGGTHVSRTGQIGIVAVRGWERFRGGTRVEFLCGRRALHAWRDYRDAVTESVRLVSVLPRELPAGLERLLEEGREAKRTIKALTQKVASYEAVALAARAESTGAARVVAEVVDGYDASALKALATSVAAAPAHVALLVSRERPVLVVVARGAGGLEIDCAACLRELLSRFGGRGGGRPELAQAGGLEAAPEQVLEAGRQLITRALEGENGL